MNNDPNPNQALFLWKMLAAESLAAREPTLSTALPKINIITERTPLIDNGYLTQEKRGATTYLSLTDKAWAWAEASFDVKLPSDDPAAQALQGLLRRLLPFLRQRELPLASLFANDHVLQSLPEADHSRAQATAKKASKKKAGRKPSRKKASKKKIGKKASTKKASKKKAGKKSSSKKASPTKAGNPLRKESALRHESAQQSQETPEANARKELSKKSAVAEPPVGSLVPTTTRVERACLELANGRRQQRVRLSALRSELDDVPRLALDQALLELQDAGRAVLYRDDNTAALTAADHEAALVVGNAPRHLVYLEA